MNTYRIAELSVNMKCTYDILERRAEKYLSTSCPSAGRSSDAPAGYASDAPAGYAPDAPADISVNVTDAAIRSLLSRSPHLTPAEAELILSASAFSRQLPAHGGFSLHASAIAYKGEAILFSAESGGGKSTHTRLWQERFGKDAVTIINDDQPVIRLDGSAAYVYGSPFSGNSEENRNVKVPLRAVVFLQQSGSDQICRIPPDRSVPLFLRRIPRYPGSRAYMEQMLSLLDRLLCTVPVWFLRCTMDEHAAVIAEEAVMGQQSP